MVLGADRGRGRADREAGAASGKPSGASTGVGSSSRRTVAWRGMTRQPPRRTASSMPKPRKISIERVLTPVARGKIEVDGMALDDERADALAGELDGGDEAGRAGADDEHADAGPGWVRSCVDGVMSFLLFRRTVVS